jgi:hypothetical protein
MTSPQVRYANEIAYIAEYISIKLVKATMLQTQLLPLDKAKPMVKLNIPPLMWLLTPSPELPKNYNTLMPMPQSLLQKLETLLITLELQEQELPPVTSESQMFAELMLYLQKLPSIIPQEAMPKPPPGIFFSI